MGGNVLADDGERADFDGVVMRGFRDARRLPGGYAHVRAALSIDGLTDHAQRLAQLRIGHVARQLHRGNTSPRTMGSRIIFGAAIVSSK